MRTLITLLLLLGTQAISQAGVLLLHSFSNNPLPLKIFIPRTGLEGVQMDSMLVVLPPMGVHTIPVEPGRSGFLIIKTEAFSRTFWISPELDQRFQFMEMPNTNQLEIMTDGPGQSEQMVVQDLLHRYNGLFPILSNQNLPTGLSFKAYCKKADSVYALQKKFLAEQQGAFTSNSYRALDQWLYYRNMEIKLRWKTLPDAKGKAKKRFYRFARKIDPAQDSTYLYATAIQALGLYQNYYLKPFPSAKLSSIEDMAQWEKLGKRLSGKGLETTRAWYILYLSERRSPEQNKAMFELFLKTYPSSSYIELLQGRLR